MSTITIPDKSVETKKKIQLKKPSRYKVIMLNDNYTTMEFVINVLISIFGRSPVKATEIMMKVHKQGRGVAGIYTFDVATTKKRQTESEAAKNGFPLKVILEKE